jgi:molybdopterin molybdotransferase
MISFEVFVRPVVSKMLGRIDTRKNVEAVVGEDIKKKKGLRYFVRAETKWSDGAYAARTTGPQGSGILKSMAVANSLIILPEEAGDIKRGASVTVEFLD